MVCDNEDLCASQVQDLFRGLFKVEVAVRNGAGFQPGVGIREGLGLSRLFTSAVRPITPGRSHAI